MATSIECSLYGVTRSGVPVEKYTLRNGNGIEVCVITYGGIITSFAIPEKNQPSVDIVLGYDELQQYEDCGVYMGCIIGRYANRIAQGEFQLDGKKYSIEKNEGDHHLHGGRQGFNKVVWEAEVRRDAAADDCDGGLNTPVTEHQHDSCRLILRHVSADLDGGFPGSLSVEVVYSLNNQNELTLKYSAEADKSTVVNLTNHSYFNLQGHQYAVADGVLGHKLLVLADKYLPADRGLPLGQMDTVAGTPMDFAKSAVLGSRIHHQHPQLLAGSGYDHTYVIAGSGPDGCLSFAARLSEPMSGRQLEVFTSQPGLQVYTANHLNGCAGKSGAEYGSRGAICLETQHFPDSPNRPEFPSTVLRPGNSLLETTVYRLLDCG